MINIDNKYTHLAGTYYYFDTSSALSRIITLGITKDNKCAMFFVKNDMTNWTTGTEYGPSGKLKNEGELYYIAKVFEYFRWAHERIPKIKDRPDFSLKGQKQARGWYKISAIQD